MLRKILRIILIVALVGLGVFILVQLIPYGKDHTNPPVANEPKWDSQQTRDLAKRACFDCHSNETVWPWYSKIAPVSWLVYRDVVEGRRRLNFSDWQPNSSYSLGEVSEVESEGEMPPFQYILMHPNAKLSAVEKQQLVSGLQNSISQ
jgi:cytochrome c551/c552